MSKAFPAVQPAARERTADAAELQRFLNAGRLASALSHELLSSLGVAQSDLAFLAELLDNPERRLELRDAAEDARAAIAGAVSRVAAVLSVARERSGQVSPVDVKEVIGAALFDLDARLASYTISRDLQPVPFALAERGALLQTLVSVLLDAADSTPPRGRIGLHLRAEPGAVVVAVDDEGPSPISPEALADCAESPLWICRNVARSFGGELTVAQGPLSGKRVSLRLRTGRVTF